MSILIDELDSVLLYLNTQFEFNIRRAPRDKVIMRLLADNRVYLCLITGLEKKANYDLFLELVENNDYLLLAHILSKLENWPELLDKALDLGNFKVASLLLNKVEPNISHLMKVVRGGDNIDQGKAHLGGIIGSV